MIEITDRVRNKELRSRIVRAEEAARAIVVSQQGCECPVHHHLQLHLLTMVLGFLMGEPVLVD